MLRCRRRCGCERRYKYSVRHSTEMAGERDHCVTMWNPVRYAGDGAPKCPDIASTHPFAIQPCPRWQYSSQLQRPAHLTHGCNRRAPTSSRYAQVPAPMVAARDHPYAVHLAERAGCMEEEVEVPSGSREVCERRRGTTVPRQR